MVKWRHDEMMEMPQQSRRYEAQPKEELNSSLFVLTFPFPFVHLFLFVICTQHHFSFSLSNKVFAHFFPVCSALFCNPSLCKRPASPLISLVRTTYVLLLVLLFTRV
jgi:hypothetical protein